MNFIINHPLLTSTLIFVIIFVGYPLLKQLFHKPTPPPKADPNRPNTSTRCWGIDKVSDKDGLFERYKVTYEEGYGSSIVEVWYECKLNYIEMKYKTIKSFYFNTSDEAQEVCDILNKDPFYYHSPEDRVFFEVNGLYKQRIPF